jgi:hypothetical protein
MEDPLDLPAHLISSLDQAQATVRENRRDRKQAATEERCASTLAGGCGKPVDILTEFRDYPSVQEYRLTRLCQNCQDRTFMPPVVEMYQDLEDFGRCRICGLWRDYIRADVGVGIIKGFNCCGTKNPPVPWPGACDKEPGCLLGKGHALDCEQIKEAVY